MSKRTIHKRSTVYHHIGAQERLRFVDPAELQLLDDYLNFITASGKSPSTISSYRYDLNLYLDFRTKNGHTKPFVTEGAREITEALSWFGSTYNWSSSRIRRMRAAISSLASYIKDHRPEDFPHYENPMENVPNPPVSKVRDDVVFSQDEIFGLLDELTKLGQLHKACMLALAISCGRRKQELIRMKTDYFTGINLINESIYKTPETVITKGHGKNGKKLYVYTVKSTFDPFLKRWMYYRSEHGIESEWLVPRFVPGTGFVDEPTPISSMDSWADTFTRILGKPFYWHSMRHYFTTSLSEAGLPWELIADVQGWEGSRMCTTYIDKETGRLMASYFECNNRS